MNDVEACMTVMIDVEACMTETARTHERTHSERSIRPASRSEDRPRGTQTMRHGKMRARARTNSLAHRRPHSPRREIACPLSETTLRSQPQSCVQRWACRPCRIMRPQCVRVRMRAVAHGICLEYSARVVVCCCCAVEECVRAISPAR